MVTTTDQDLITTDQNPATIDQNPPTTDQDLTTTDQDLTTTDQNPATIDQNPPTLATTGIDLDARLLAKKHQHLFKLLNITMPCKLYKMKQSVVEHYHNLLVHLYTCLCVCLLLVYYFSSEHGVTIK